MLAFILGRSAYLSLAELSHKLDSEKVIEVNSQFVLTGQEIPEPQAFLNHLGGTKKIVEVGIQETDIIKMLSKTSANKIAFGFSFYGVDKKTQNQWEKKGLEIKKQLKRAGRSARFVSHREAEMSAVMIRREHAQDIVILPGQIGRTVACQDFHAYAKRDYEKPVRDMKIGMLPPKLAQIMLNIADLKAGQMVYDPFCGLGSIPMEALLMNINVIASDINEEMVTATKQNIASLGGIAAKWEAEVNDATKNKRDDFAAIVTEGYLGPHFDRYPTEEEIGRWEKEIASLYLGFFQNISTTKPIIICLPLLKKGENYRAVPQLKEKIMDLGYQLLPNPQKDWTNKTDLLKLGSPSMIYGRVDQIIAREICKWQRI